MGFHKSVQGLYIEQFNYMTQKEYFTRRRICESPFTIQSYNNLLMYVLSL